MKPMKKITKKEMIKKVKEILTKENFEIWLKSRSRKSIVGRPLTCSFCPVAKWLSWGSGYRVIVGGSLITVKSGFPVINQEVTIPAPSWVLAFILEVDASSASTVSAGRCLSILKSLN